MTYAGKTASHIDVEKDRPLQQSQVVVYRISFFKRYCYYVKAINTPSLPPPQSVTAPQSATPNLSPTCNVIQIPPHPLTHHQTRR